MCSSALPSAPGLLTSLQTGCRTRQPCIVAWIYQKEPDIKTSETTERNSLASSDDRAKEYCSGPASFRFLVSK